MLRGAVMMNIAVRVSDELSCIACERDEDATHTVSVPRAPVGVMLRAAFIAARVDVIAQRYDAILVTKGERAAELYYATAYDRIAPRATDEERAARVHASYCRVTRV